MYSWFRENKLAFRDILVLLFFEVIIGVILVKFEWVEKFYDFSRQYESWNLDDITLITFTLFTLCLTIFATRRWRELHKLLKDANTDILTGLFNRRKGWEVLEIEIDRSRRYNRPMSVILFDLDHFKSVNDTYGHLVGDQVLNLVANLALKQLRSSDILIRWGGEEFLIVCAETTHVGSVHLAERLRIAIEEANIPNVGNITASFGVVELHNEDDFNNLFNRVDTRLYSAKNNGRNTVV